MTCGRAFRFLPTGERYVAQFSRNGVLHLVSEADPGRSVDVLERAPAQYRTHDQHGWPLPRVYVLADWFVPDSLARAAA